jgi:hypothetical protein
MTEIVLVALLAREDIWCRAALMRSSWADIQSHPDGGVQKK